MTKYNINDKVVLYKELEVGEDYGLLEWKEATDYIKELDYVTIDHIINGDEGVYYKVSSGSKELFITKEMISHFYGERIGEDSLYWKSDGATIEIECLICGTTDYIYSDNASEDLEKIQLGSNPFNNMMWENGAGEMLKCKCQHEFNYDKIRGMNVLNLKLQLENEDFKFNYDNVKLNEAVGYLKANYENENKGQYVTYYNSLSDFKDSYDLKNENEALHEIKKRNTSGESLDDISLQKINEGFVIIDEVGSNKFDVYLKDVLLNDSMKNLYYL